MKDTTMRGFAEKRHKRSVLNHYKRMVDTSDKPGKSASIFEHKSQSQSDRTTDLVNADCINHGYRLADVLGEGAYAKVKKADIMPSKLARNQTIADIAGDSGQMEVAIKIIDKKQVPKDFLMKFLPRELANHLKIPSHPNIVRLYEQFSSQNHVYMVMEYCSNGDLLDLINKHIGQNQKGIGEETTRKIFLQICSAVQHLHKHLLVHRDLKCENILLDENMDCKLTDFGFSCKVATTDTHLKTSCGSYAYTAPEVIRAKPYDGFRSDIWSLGIILFAMVNGRLPFNDNQLMEMEEEMKMQRLKFERSVSFDCMVLIRKILQYHPSVRPPLDEVIDDKWLTGNKPIPRQVTKPKWTNPYKCQEKVTPDIDNLRVDQTSAPRRSKPICFKASPNKGHSNPSTRTVTLNQAAGETVTLKSRRVPRPGPKLPLRPNTWPKTAKDQKDSGTGAASRKPNFRYIAQLVMMNKDKLDPSPTPCSGKEGVCKQMPLWFMYNKLFRDQCKADSASGGDSKCTKSGKPNSAVKARETAKVDSKDKPNPDSKSKSNCPSRSGSAGKIATPRARVGSTGSKSENTENKRCGFPQRSYAKKGVTANTRNGTVKFPVEGSTKQMTPKSANFILGRTRVTVTTASPGISKSAVTSISKAKETACTPRATEVTPHGEGYKPKVEPKLKFEEEISSLLSPSELQLLPPLMGQTVKHHEGEVRQYQGNRRMSFCPRMKKHRQRVIVHSCT